MKISTKKPRQLNNNKKVSGKSLKSPVKKSFNKKGQASAAAAYATGQYTQVPEINSTRSSSRIRHRELIASIIGNVTFDVAFSFGLNPGLATTFPWLSTQALGWEQYHFNKLSLVYYTRTGTSTPGSVLIAPDYDAADAAPLSEQVMSSYQNCVEDAVWKDIECRLDERSMHPDGPRKYIRQGPLASNLDIKTYDVGTAFVAVTDGTAVNWGKLWIEYDITFYTPQLPSSGLLDNLFQSVISTAPSATNLLGITSSQTTVPGSSLIYSVANEVVTFYQGGTFLMIYELACNNGAITANITAGGGLVFQKYGLGAFPVSVCQTVALNQILQVCLITTAQGGTLTFNNTMTSGTLAELTILAVPQNFA